MFWSKIWFFLVAVAAAAAAVAALVMPRPAEREAQESERELLERACSVTEILLRDNARARIQLAGEFARAGAPGMRIDEIAHRASRADEISASISSDGRQALGRLLEQVEGTRPEIAILLDTRGRVVARRGIESIESGDSLRGRDLVDDALYGYLRDDLWVLDDSLYRMAASPIVTRRSERAGAILLAHPVNKRLTDQLSDTLHVDIGFYVAGGPVATSNPLQLHSEFLERFDEIGGAQRDADASSDCDAHEPFVVSASGSSYTALIARLPGEAGVVGGFYTVFVEHTESVGLLGMMSRVTRSDLSPSRFPWIPTAAGFLLAVVVGLFLLAFEGDRPLRKLNTEAVEIAKGERERFDEDRHPGKYGSIARSVNIAVDKLKRDTKAARRDLDELLGPAPASGGGAGEGLPPDPLAGDAPAAPPPPSEFSFGDTSKPKPAAAPDPLGLGQAPPPQAKPSAGPPPAPPPVPGKTSAKGKGAPRDQAPPPIPPAPAAAPASPSAPGTAIDEDILGAGEGENDLEETTSAFDGATTRVAEPSPEQLAASARDDGDQDAHFRQIFDEFLALKKTCGESTRNLTYEAFADKLRSNRDALMAKHGCKSVRFQVYEKDGKAALKASPMKS